LLLDLFPLVSRNRFVTPPTRTANSLRFHFACGQGVTAFSFGPARGLASVQFGFNQPFLHRAANFEPRKPPPSNWFIPISWLRFDDIASAQF